MAQTDSFTRAEDGQIQESKQLEHHHNGPLPELPNEISTYIFSYITGLRTLRNACLASKLLRRIAEARLYRKLITGLPTPFATAYARNTHTVRAALLMLLRRPELGKCVRKVVVRGHFYPSGYDHKNRLEEDDQIISVAKEANIWPTLDWIQQDERNFRSLYLGLLLTQVPHLRELRYSTGYDDNRHVEAFVKIASQSLTQLTTLRVEHQDWGMDFPMELFSPLLHMTSLRTFKAFKAHLEYGGFGIDPQHFSANSLAIEHLIFRSSALGPRCISALLRACRTLKTFDYVARGSYHEYIQFGPHALMRVLRRHESTLERLLLTDLRDACFKMVGQELSTGYALGSLASFSRLKVVSGDQAILIGIGECEVCADEGESDRCTHEHDRSSCEQCLSLDEDCLAADRQNLCSMLPSSIESLWIQRCDGKILPHLRELASLRSEKFPHLKDIMLEIGEAEFRMIMDYFPEEGDEEEVLIMERISREDEFHHYWLDHWAF